jgi:hypothetical protein
LEPLKAVWPADAGIDNVSRTCLLSRWERIEVRALTFPRLFPSPFPKGEGQRRRVSGSTQTPDSNPLSFDYSSKCSNYTSPPAQLGVYL